MLLIAAGFLAVGASAAAFRLFLKEIERKYPHCYAEGEFADLIDLLADLSRETSEAGVRLSDMAVVLAREPTGVVERLYIPEKLGDDLKELGSPEKVCAQRLP